MYTMKQVCNITGLNYETLKYYCNINLIPNIKRDKNNRRIFSENNLLWIQCMLQLKKCNFSIDELKLFLTLSLQGQSTIMERENLLQKKRDFLTKEIADLQNSISFIDQKQTFYHAVLNGETEYVCPLLADN